ncbi:hypothetical protein GGP41_010754, partial [Bipolaris sorokiniana]
MPSSVQSRPAKMRSMSGAWPRLYFPSKSEKKTYRTSYKRVEKYCTAVPSLSLDPSPQSDSTEPTSIQNVLSTDRETNVATMLREAVSQVQKLRLQTFSKSVITQHVHIPPKLAKTWIKAYFSHMHTDMFITLVNEKLIEAIPDLLESPHIYLDPAVLVVYYNVLYHGCVFGPKITGPLRAADYTSALYVCCLRSLPLWQREATGTSTDLIAALLMVDFPFPYGKNLLRLMLTHQSHTAAGSFDDTLSWEMHKRACNYAQRLNLHNLDAPSVGTVSNDSTLDADRKHFWELIQLDFLFRLLFDRPPVLTESTKSWNINLPWLSDIQQPDLSAVSIAAFLVGARLCFILSQFFHTLESADHSERSTLPMTESYCSEINQVFLEYDLEQRIIESAAEGQTFRLWRLSDTALMGYNYIILMIRKVEFSQNTDASDSGACERETFDSPLAVDAARRMLHV